MFVGVVNGTAGGLLRDVIVREVPAILRPGQFVTLLLLVACALFMVLTRYADVSASDAAWTTACSFLFSVSWRSASIGLHGQSCLNPHRRARRLAILNKLSSCSPIERTAPVSLGVEVSDFRNVVKAARAGDKVELHLRRLPDRFDEREHRRETIGCHPATDVFFARPLLDVAYAQVRLGRHRAPEAARLEPGVCYQEPKRVD